MVFLIALIAIFFPRIALFLLWLLTPYVEQGPFSFWLWPLLGLIFVPYTTLALVLAFNTGFFIPQILLIIIGVLADIGASSNYVYVRRRRYVLVEEPA